MPQAVTILERETYLAMIRNSIGSHLFRTVRAEVDGTKRDILENGQLSCAFFVSSILHSRQLIKAPHTTVAGLLQDMERSGWCPTTEPHEGCVIAWEEQQQKSGVHAHVGFYLNADEAVSHSDAERTPVIHHPTFHDQRRIVAVYTHPSVEQ